MSVFVTGAMRSSKNQRESAARVRCSRRVFLDTPDSPIAEHK
jgi:hypothetical protein